MWRLIGIVAILWGAAAQAQNWHTPARGSVERRALMDAARPHAEWMLGAPVQFVVDDLRVGDGVAFAALSPQRPGGVPIDPARTPMVQRDGWEPEFMGGVAMQVLYVKSGSVWVALHWAVGATDVWYAAPELCAVFWSVIPEVCVG
ncbi:hypothetical protein [Actibacterium sp. D379-3]